MTDRISPLEALRGIGTIEVTIRGIDGKKNFHWRDGNLQLGLLKTLDTVCMKTGIDPITLLKEIERAKAEKRAARAVPRTQRAVPRRRR